MDALDDIMKKVKDKIDDFKSTKIKDAETNEEVEDWYQDVGECPEEIIKSTKK